ncbi:MAG: hypothetical protein KAT66_00610 [Candidatus Lokiarchaeota archaeon]|nr:hypothetical protein [Candidatus Lokiarchaeota archaeon]
MDGRRRKRSKEEKKKMQLRMLAYYANGGVHPMKGKKHSDEAKEKIRLKMLGRKATKVTLEKMKKAHLGISNKWNEEAKERRRKQWAGKSWGGIKFKKGNVPWNKGLTKETSEIVLAVAEGKKGEKNCNWKNGVTQSARDKCKRELKEWREKVFKRDNYICQKTKIKGNKLAPHHIKPFAKYTKLRFAISNGITLSEESHKEFHKIYGYDCNEKQLKEFLN